MIEQTKSLGRANENETFLRGLIGAATLLLVARAVEPLFFGQAYYATLAIHPFWIVVILAAVQSGFYVGVTTAAAAAISMDWPARPAGVDITAHYIELAIVPVQWLLAAIVLGAFREGQIRREEWLGAENDRLQQINEDLATEVQRMDSAIAELELNAATMGIRDDADMRPKSAHELGGDVGAELILSTLAELAMSVPETFEAKFAEAAKALGFADAVFHVECCVPMHVGSGRQLTAREAESLLQLIRNEQITESRSANVWQVAIGIDDDGFVAAMMPARSSAPRRTADDSRGDYEETAVPAEAVPIMSEKAAIARVAALAAAIRFSGYRPSIHFAPALGGDTTEHSA